MSHRSVVAEAVELCADMAADEAVEHVVAAGLETGVLHVVLETGSDHNAVGDALAAGIRELGGAVTAVKATGQMTIFGPRPDSAGLMRELKARLDPADILPAGFAFASGHLAAHEAAIAGEARVGATS